MAKNITISPQFDERDFAAVQEAFHARHFASRVGLAHMNVEAFSADRVKAALAEYVQEIVGAHSRDEAMRSFKPRRVVVA